MDNLERALAASDSKDPLYEGLKMVMKQFEDALKSAGVEYIESVGQKFDPKFHNAVMHVDDENYGENEIVEEFQKGYKIGDRIVRHSMVKVAN
jgi:molecular chaperone GrpE